MRLPWRLLAFLAILLAVTGVLFLATLPLNLADEHANETAFVEQYGLVCLATTLAVLLARRYIDQRTVSSLGLRLDRRAPVDFAAGVALGGVLIALIFVAFDALGFLHLQQTAARPLSSGHDAVLPAFLLLLIGLFSGWTEELTFRGYLQENLIDGLNLPWGVVLTMILFSLMHLGNPGAGLASTLGILCAGLLLAYGRLRTGQLWLSIGLHAGWNFFLSFFGFTVSGADDFFHLLHITVHGPALFTGGVFGPEAGILMLPIALIGIGGIALWARARGET